MRSRLWFTRFRFTSIAVALAIIIALAAQIASVNLIQLPLRFLARIENNELDEIITTLLLVVAGFIVDQVVEARRRESKLQLERLRIVRATMRTVQDIVNNCLNQLQLVRLEAEGHIPQESIELFDDAIKDTFERLKNLGELQAYTEHQMASGTGTGPYTGR